MSLRRGAVAGAGVAAGLGLAYAVQRTATLRWQVGADELAAAGRTLPGDLRHHFVAVSDGGRIHAVERGGAGIEAPTVVLVHGICLGIATWAPQLRGLGGRVVAVSQRGHGQSQAGADGYRFDRLGTDLLEVLDALDVRDAVLVGHSMGGMIAQLLAVTRPEELAGRVRRLVLVATTPGPLLTAPFSAFITAGTGRVLAAAERRGRGPFPSSLSIWAARTAFGARPSPADIQLLCWMLDAMSPAALAELLPHLLAFDVRERLGSVSLPTHAVVGTRDVLTPARTSRAIAARIPGARLTTLPGSGHMVMLERAEALCDLLR